MCAELSDEVSGHEMSKYNWFTPRLSTLMTTIDGQDRNDMGDMSDMTQLS